MSREIVGLKVGASHLSAACIEVNGSGHDHSFVRRGPEMRTAVVTTDDSSGERRVWVVSGVQDLVILKSTGSGFKGFLPVMREGSEGFAAERFAETINVG